MGSAKNHDERWPVDISANPQTIRGWQTAARQDSYG
jgi:hypothetical protein